MNKIEKGPAFWKAFGQAAALWAAVAVAGSLLLPGGSMTLPEEPEKILVASASIHGHTRSAAHILAEKLRAKGAKVVEMDLTRTDV